METAVSAKRIISEAFPSNPLILLGLDMERNFLAMQERYVRSELKRLRIPRLHAEIHTSHWRFERTDDVIRMTCEISVKPTVIGQRPLPD